MKYRSQKISAMVALLVTFGLAQSYIHVSFAEPLPGPKPAVAPASMGVLTTTNNKPVIVNGANAVSGASIPSGATIETPSGVGATIRLSGLGSVCISPSSRVTLTFDSTSININILLGCAILRTNKNIAGAVSSAQGNLATINNATGGSVDVCLKADSTATINQGAAVDAGAGASAVDCGAAGAAAIPTGIPPAVAIAFIAGGAGGLYVLFRGSNPSPST